MYFIRSLIAFLKDREYQQLLATSVVILGLGTVAYRLLEGWDWIDCVYFCVITLTTIGYGDFCPQTPGGKIFTIFYILLGLGMIISFIHTVYDHFSYTRPNDVEI